jgi:hypothetical protein
MLNYYIIISIEFKVIYINHDKIMFLNKFKHIISKII